MKSIVFMMFLVSSYCFGQKTKTGRAFQPKKVVTENIRVKKITTNEKGAANVRLFGAKLDGITDDAPAIQAALNLSKQIFIPDGIGIVGAPLIIKDSQSIFGTGSKSVLKAKTDNISVFTGTSVSHITIKDLSIDGGGQINNSVKAGIKGVFGIFLNNVRYFEINNVTIKNCGVTHASNSIDDAGFGGFGILVQAITGEAAYGKITRCNVSNIAGGGYYAGDGIYIGGQNASSSVTTHDIVVEKCNVTKTGRHSYAVATGTASIPTHISIKNCYGSYTALCGVDIEPGNNVNVDSCHFDHCGNDQTYYDPVSIPQFGGTYGLLAGISITNGINNINISNTYFNNCYYGITYGAANGVRISNCVTENSVAADLHQFLAGAPTGFIITDCKFATPLDITTFYYTVNSSYSGVATNCTFAGGIYASLANGFTFLKCTFLKGFHFSGPNQRGLVFDDCYFKDYNGAGISCTDILRNISDVTIKNCKFLGTGKMAYGILLGYHDAYNWIVEGSEFSGQTIAGYFNSNAAGDDILTSCSRNKFDSCGIGININQALKNGIITNNSFYNVTQCIKVANIIAGVDMTNTIISKNVAGKGCVNGITIETSTGDWDYNVLSENDMRTCSGIKWSVSPGNTKGIVANNFW